MRDVLILTSRCMEIHGKIAVLLPKDPSAGTDPDLLGLTHSLLGSSVVPVSPGQETKGQEIGRNRDAVGWQQQNDDEFFKWR